MSKRNYRLIDRLIPFCTYVVTSVPFTKYKESDGDFRCHVPLKSIYYKLTTDKRLSKTHLLPTTYDNFMKWVTTELKDRIGYFCKFNAKISNIYNLDNKIEHYKFCSGEHEWNFDSRIFLYIDEKLCKEYIKIIAGNKPTACCYTPLREGISVWEILKEDGISTRQYSTFAQFSSEKREQLLKATGKKWYEIDLTSAAFQNLSRLVNLPQTLQNLSQKSFYKGIPNTPEYKKNKQLSLRVPFSYCSTSDFRYGVTSLLNHTTMQEAEAVKLIQWLKDERQKYNSLYFSEGGRKFWGYIMNIESCMKELLTDFRQN